MARRKTHDFDAEPYLPKDHGSPRPEELKNKQVIFAQESRRTPFFTFKKEESDSPQLPPVAKRPRWR